MKRQKQKGFDLAPDLGLFASRDQDGLWSAWVENDAPPSSADDTIKIHVGSSAFQAQLKAIRSLPNGQNPPKHG